MQRLATLFTLFVAISHVGILIMEMFFWNHALAQKVFLLTPEFTESTVMLAMNQGLYNGFLAAGLFWGIFAKRVDLKLFFLGCVICAGIFGAFTVKASIVFTQGLPAMIAFVLVFMNARGKSD